MKLFEMEKLPELAGDAALVFDKTSVVGGIVRQNAQITFQVDRESDFYPLKNGAQFLCRQAQNSTLSEWPVFFGGTDERPFLVRLKPEAFQHFKHGGESAFYSGLIPETIVRFRSRFKESFKRQGDFFAYPVPLGLDDVESFYFSFKNLTFDFLETKATVSIFGTRHQFEGEICVGNHDVSILYFNGGNGESFIIVNDGILTAPDHSPLELEGTHVIVQARNLWEPQKAD